MAFARKWVFRVGMKGFLRCLPSGNYHSPFPLNLWTHPLAGNFTFNLWAAAGYGQNLETKGTYTLRLPARPCRSAQDETVT
jgi:hypothetical protein